MLLHLNEKLERSKKITRCFIQVFVNMQVC